MPALADLGPGTVFAGRYRIERLLKAGGMGAVYVVRHVKTGAVLALKVMNREMVQDPDSRLRFAQEARVASLIDSAHVVTVTDADVDEATGIPFLVMELLRGRELGELLAEQGRIAPEQVLTWLAHAARGLDKAHAKGIVHRDLKPENLFLVQSDDEPPKVKILDFGIAKIVQSATTPTTTQASGTPFYMAPEQTSSSAKIGPHTDVWALGLIAYTLLVGRSYWEATAMYELFGEILRPEREPASARAAKRGVALPPAFDAWFARCVALDPAARFASAGETVAALAEVYARAPVVTPVSPRVVARIDAGVGAEAALDATTPNIPSSLASAPSPTPRRSFFPLWLGIGGVAIAAGVVAVLVAREGGKAWRSSPGASSATGAGSSTSNSVQSSPPSWRDEVAKSNPFVPIAGIELQAHEVTRAEVAQWIDSLPKEAKAGARPLRAWSGEPVDSSSAKRPVTWITQSRAARFCGALGARLPRSDEWSKAAGTAYPWGAAWPPPEQSAIAIARGDEAVPVVVASSPLDVISGVHDLLGNAREWTSTVDNGFAVLRGASVATPLASAKDALTAIAQKPVVEGDDPSSRADELADALLGFRCARSSATEP